MLKAANSVCSPWYDHAEFHMHSRYSNRLRYLQEKRNAIKIECAREVTTLYIDFSEDQGQLTLTPVMGSGRNSNSSMCLLLSLIPARMSKDPLKIEVS